jgi:RNA polymerase sigma factor (sigma-70 family)
MQDPSDVTQLLLRWSQGDQEAVNRLFPTVYEELKRLAHARVRHEHSDHTLNTTALVHEAYIKLVDLDRMNWKDRAHFFALASRVMRHLLVNYAHQRKAMKRGGEWKRVELDEDRLMPDADLQLDRVADGGLVREVDQGLIPDVEVERLLELDEALTQLAAEHPRPAKAIEQSYFGGLTNEETAAVLGISLATVERDLRLARAWLARSLGRELHA